MKGSEKRFKWFMIILQSFGMSFPLWRGISLEGLSLTFLFSTLIFIWYDWIFEEGGLT